VLAGSCAPRAGNFAALTPARSRHRSSCPNVRAAFAPPRCAVRGASSPARWGLCTRPFLYIGRNPARTSGFSSTASSTIVCSRPFAAERSAVHAVLAGSVGTRQAATRAQASDVRRARPHTATGDRVSYGQCPDPRAAVGTRAIEPAVLALTGYRRRARVRPRALELEQLDGAADARAAGLVTGAGDLARARADDLTVARALSLAANVAVGEDTAHDVLHASAVSADDVARFARRAQDLLLVTAARLVTVEVTRPIEAAATAPHALLAAAAVARGQRHRFTTTRAASVGAAVAAAHRAGSCGASAATTCRWLFRAVATAATGLFGRCPRGTPRRRATAWGSTERATGAIAVRATAARTVGARAVRTRARAAAGARAARVAAGGATGTRPAAARAASAGTIRIARDRLIGDFARRSASVFASRERINVGVEQPAVVVAGDANHQKSSEPASRKPSMRPEYHVSSRAASAPKARVRANLRWSH
jgi:hypothetical protein